MLSLLRRTGAILVLLVIPALHARPAAADTVLIVVSGEGRDQGRTRPGFEMDEFAQACLIFRDNGLGVQVADTRATATLSAADYAAVYVVGGKGAMFGLSTDRALRALLGTVHDRGGIVAAVRHGPTALVEVRRADGLPHAGRGITVRLASVPRQSAR